MKKLFKRMLAMALVAVTLVTAVPTMLYADERVLANGSEVEAGAEKVKLSDNYIKDVIKNLEEKEFVSKATYNLQGRLLSIMITVNDDTNIDDAKNLGKIVIQGFNEEELAYYDLQVFLKDSGTKEESRYPFIGTKHKTSEEFVWSNN